MPLSDFEPLDLRPDYLRTPARSSLSAVPIPRPKPADLAEPDGLDFSSVASEKPTAAAPVPRRKPAEEKRPSTDIDFSSVASETPLESGVGPAVKSAGASFVQGAAETAASLPQGMAVADMQNRRALRAKLDAVDAATAGKTPEQVQAEIDQSFKANWRPPDYMLGLDVDFKDYPTAPPEKRAEIRKLAGLDATDMADPRQNAWFKAGEGFKKMVEENVPTNPLYAESFIAGTVPRALGSTVPFLATGIAGSALRIPALMSASATGLIAGKAGQFTDAMENGASLDDAFKASDMGAVVGMSEGLPIATFLNRLDRGTGGTVRRMLIDVAKQGTEEAAQEAFQSISENLIANRLVAYDPERGTFTGTAEGTAAGFTVGALMQFVASVAAGRRGRAHAPAQQPAPVAAPTPQPNFAETFGDQPAPAGVPTPDFATTFGESGQPQASPTPDGLDISSVAAETPAAAQPADPEQEAVLRAANYTDQQIADMAPEERARAAAEAVEAGVKPAAIDPEATAKPAQNIPDLIPEEAQEGTTRLYRGEGGSLMNSEQGGGWFTTDPAKAAKYAEGGGQVVYVDVTDRELGSMARDGKGSQDEFWTDNKAVLGRTKPHSLDISSAASEGAGDRAAPVKVSGAADIDRAAAAAAPDYTPAQGEANNRKLGHVKWQGMDGTVEVASGGVRKGMNPETGETWETTHTVPYGYWNGTKGADDMHVDVYWGPEPEAGHPVYVLDELDPKTGAFRQHKTFAGFASEQAAKDAYLGTSTKSEKMVGGVTAMPVEQFRAWLKSGKTTKRLTQAPAKVPPDGGQLAGADQSPAGRGGAPSQQEIHGEPKAVPNPAPPTGPLDKMLDDDLSPHDRRKLFGGKDIPETLAGAIGKRSERETDYGRLTRMAAIIQQIEGQSHRPHQSGKGKKAEAAHAEALKGWEAKRAQIEPIKRSIADKRAKLIAEAMEKAGIKNGDTVRYTDEVLDGRSGETREGDTVGPVTFNMSTPTAQLYSRGGIMLLNPDDIAERLQKVEAKEPTTAADVGAGEADLPEGSYPFPTMAPEKIFPAPKATIRAADTAGPKISEAAAKAKVEEWKAIAKKIGEMFPQNDGKAILSLFDYTGSWSRPWKEAGFEVFQYDVQFAKDHPDYHPGDEKYRDVLEFFPIADISEIKERGGDIYGVLAATPCTTFANSGTRWRETLHDAKSREAIEKVFGPWVPEIYESPLEVNQALVNATILAVELANPSGFHVMENPVGRIAKVNDLPDPLLRFDPNHYGDPYTKKTQLWGSFDPNLPSAHVDATEGSKVSEKLRGDRPEDKIARSTTPEGFAYAFFIANAPKDQVAAARKALAGEADKTEHPGLVIKSLQTGKEEIIQPKGTVPPKAKKAKAEKPAPAAKPQWKPIGKNAKGLPVYEDERGVRSYTEKGVRISETVGIQPGGGISVKRPAERDFEPVEEKKPEPHSKPAEKIIEPEPAKPDMAEIERQEKGQAAAAKAKAEAEREAPQWAEVLYALPKDGKGRPDIEAAQRLMLEITGDPKASFKDLTPDQRIDLLAKAKAAADALKVPDRPAGYGQKNTLVTKERAEELRARLKAKLTNQVNAGIDPEILAIGAELAAFHIEAGARKFADLAKAIAKDLGVPLSTVRPYLRSWYNGARDMMEDAGIDIAGMDDPDQVRAGLKALNEGQEAPADEPAAVEGASPPALEGAQPDPVQGTERRGDAGRRTRLRGAADASRDVEPGSERPDERGSLGEDEGRVSVPAAEPVKPAVRPAAGRPAGYVLTDEDAIGEGGAKTKARQNLEAIKLLKADRPLFTPATPAEQAVLAKYVGWGGIKQIFPREDGSYAEGWQELGEELKRVLTDAEYKAARASTQNAHYTSPTVVKAMWQAVQRLGFRGGRILEPSVGTGNFLGFMPTELREGTQINAVELDRITGTIAKNLYPGANVQAPVGFQDFNAPDGWFDLAIGNPPFGAVRVYDERRKKISRFTIHNFFFAKSVDMLRDDGVLAMVVTNFFMDSSRDGAREYVAGKTELIGAIRLPNDAFAKNAGTEVTTDIIFLRKLKADEKPKGESWLEAKVFKDKEGREMLLNEYFHRHPEMMLGEFGAYGTMYGNAENAALIPRKGQDTTALLNAAIARLPSNVMPAPGEIVEPEKPIAPANAAQAVEGSMFLDDKGKAWIKKPDIAGEAQAEPVDFESDRARDRVTGMIRIRDAFARLRGAQLDEAATDPQIAKLRKVLNTVYDAFVQKQGPINQDSNKKLFRDDPTWPQISALEDSFDRGLSETVAKKTGEKPRSPSATKAPVFTKRTQSPYHPPESASSAKDALAATLVETGRVDMAMMQRLYGRAEEDIVRELGDLLFKNPVGGYETRDHYLSGNVKQKLAIAQRAAEKDPQYRRNIEALQTAIPADIEAIDINVKPGGHWLPPKHVADFADYLFDRKGASAVYVPTLAQWTIAGKTNASDAAAAARWGTERVDVSNILTAVLNGRTITVRDHHSDGTSTVNQAATDAANAKVEAVKEEWKRWVWQDDARREDLHRLYNDSFNTDRQREYDGSHLTFPGKVGDDIIRLRPHQANMVWRIVQSGTALLDHVVGAGKTFTMIGAAMELRRMGLAKKPMFVVPNHLVGQWAADFIKLYPGAKVLAASKKDFEAENRKRLFARVATGDYDAVIVAHSSFGKVGVDPKFEQRFIEDQVADLEASIKAVKEATGEKKNRTVAQIEKQRDNLKAKLQRLLDGGGKDDNLTFEELGVDALFIDEAHEFKNLGYSTSMQRVAGLGNQTGSQKAADLYVKTLSVLERTGGRNVVFATGTPISNTMAEMFTMQRYLDGRALKDMGLAHFDAWARMFGEVVSDWELSPAGKYKLNSRFSKFVNMPELMQRYLSFSDVITNDDIKRQLAAQGRTLPLPRVKGGKPQNVVVERSPAQAAFIGIAEVNEYGAELYPKGTLIWRSENLPKGPPQKGDDNMLKIMSDARKAALDMRLVHAGAGDTPGSKVHVAADNILRIHKATAKDRGTQLVFIDLSTPKGAAAKEAAAIRELMARAEAGDEAAQEKLDAMSPDEFMALEAGSFSVYDDLKQKLIDRGIPAHEIAFIHDANTELQKEELFGKVRAGRVRVLLGSTAKMGAGTNVQNRLVALHHLDAPWRPSDLEQREGRIVRQGNELYIADPENFEVEILRYATKNTLDARMWQTIEGKARFIEQVRKGDSAAREIEDVAGEAANAAEMKAAASGNPLILEEMDLRQQLRKLDTARYNHDREQHRIRDVIRFNRSAIDRAEAALPNAVKDAEAASTIPGKFAMTVAGQSFEKPKEAGEAILVEYGKFVDGGAETSALGSYGPFRLRLASSKFGHSVVMVGANQYSTGISNDADATGLAMRIRNTVADLVGEPGMIEAGLAKARAEIPKLEAQIAPWADAEKHQQIKARHEAVLAELKPKPKPAEPAKTDNQGPPSGGPSDSGQVLGSTIPRGQDAVSGFYSALLRAAEASKLSKAPADQWRATLANQPGVKPEEMEWVLADLPAGTLTKAEVVEHVRANQVQVREVMRGRFGGKPTEADGDEILAWAEERSDRRLMHSVTDIIGSLEDGNITGRQAAGDLEGLGVPDELLEPFRNYAGGAGGPKYETYQLPGGEDYRELLLTLPALDKPADTTGWKVLPGGYLGGSKIVDANGKIIAETLDPIAPENHALAIANAAKPARDSGSDYRSGHWEEPNVVVHARFNTRTVGNRKVLLVEEIQSDWHQAGRKRGYQGDRDPPIFKEDDVNDIDALRPVLEDSYPDPTNPDRMEEVWMAVDGRGDSMTNSGGFPDAYTSRERAIEAINRYYVRIANNNRVPNAPFKGQAWQEMAFKRMVRYAAENGYDEIAWTPGDVQNERYSNDLRQRIRNISWFTSSHGGGKVVQVQRTDMGRASFDIDQRGVVTRSPDKGMGGAVGRTIEDLFGKEIAKRIIGEEKGTVAGDNLFIGGEGMRGAYDKILPNIAGKIGKRFGAKVGTTKVDAGKSWIIRPKGGGMTMAMLPSEEEARKTLEGMTYSRNFEIVHDPEKDQAVWSLPITDAMRASVMDEGQALFKRAEARLKLEPRQVANLARTLRNIIRSVAGRDVQVQFSETIDAEEAGDAEYNRAMERYREAGGRLGATAGGRSILNVDGRAIIQIALEDPKFDPLSTAYHEAYHRVEGHLMTDAEFAAVEAETERLRPLAAAELGLDPNAPEVAAMPGYEVRAIAFERYARFRREGRSLTTTPGLPRAINRFFEMLYRLLARVRKALTNKGFNRYEDIFESVLRGETAGRPTTFRALTDYGNTAERGETLGVTIPHADHPEVELAMWHDRAQRFMGRVRSLTDPARRLIQDRYVAIKRMQEALEAEVGQIGTPINVYQAIRLYVGRAGERLVDLQNERIEPLLEDMRARGIDADRLDRYLYARHAPERNARMAEINPNTVIDGEARGSGMSDREARAIMSGIEAEGRMADYEALAAQVDQIIAWTREELVASGLVSRETVDAWEETYPNYVPLRGFDDPAAHTDAQGIGLPRVGRGFDVRGKEAKAALGRLSAADSPLAYVFQQAQQAIVRAEKNRTLKTVLRFAQHETVAEADLFRVDRGQTARRLNPQTGLVETYVIPPNFSRAENLFAVKVGGVTHWIEVRHEGYARALRGVGSSIDNVLARALLRVSHAYARLLTQWNPEFVPVNAVRDMETALVNVSEFAGLAPGIRTRMLKDAFTLRSVRGALGAMYGRPHGSEYAEAYEEFRRAGGKVSFVEMNDVDRIKRDIDRSLRRGQTMRALHNVGELVGNLNTAVENAVRLSVYKHLRDAGVDRAKAAMIARDLTTDFNLRGEWGATINALYIFFNASIQGTFRLAAAVARSRVARVAVAGIFSLGFAMEFLNAMLSGDDDDDGQSDYDAIADYERQRNIILMLPNGGNIKFPMAYGYNVFYVAGQQLAAALRGQRTAGQSAMTMLATAADSFNPLGSFGSISQMISPWFSDPFVQSGENKKFHGGPIMPTVFDDKKPLSETYFKSAPKWAIKVAELLNVASGGNKGRPGWADISPETIEHFAEFAGGGVGQFLVKSVKTAERMVNAEEWLPEETPLLRRFYGRADSDAALERRFFEAMNEVDQAHFEQVQLRKAGRSAEADEAKRQFGPELEAYGAFNAARQARTKIRADRQAAERMTDPAAKTARIERLDEIEHDLMRKALQKYRRREEN